MKRRTARAIHSAVAILGATGCALAWMTFFWAPPADAEVFAIEHPWQAAATALHILAGPALAFLLGLVWTNHVWARIRSGAKKRRQTGLLLAFLFPALAISGYALQIATAARDWLGWIHAGVGVAFGVTYLWHQFLPAAVRPNLHAAKRRSEERAPAEGTRNSST